MDSEELPSEEYDALTSGKGFVELADWSTVTMTGEDRVTFLHNMCTNDIKRLSVGESCEAFCTDVKGKIIAQTIVIAHADKLALLAVPEHASTLIAHLDRYIIREDVTLADESDALVWLYLSASCIDEHADDSSLVDDFILVPWNGMPGCVASCTRSDLPAVKERFQQLGYRECSGSAWEIVRVENSLPLEGVDFDSSNLPQEINRDEVAISFNKGCYLGQETIARIDALGHVNQKVVTVQLASDVMPSRGLELHLYDKVVGTVTSICWSPKHQSPLGLAMVRRGANETGTDLESEVGTVHVV